MRDLRRRSQDRVHQGRGKKLTEALRYQLERKATDDFILDLIDDGEAGAELADMVQRPEEFPSDLLVYLSAFNRLMHDRHYGAFGGATPIHYIAISAYARDFGIAGDDFDTFLLLIGALDAEYLAHLERTRPAKPVAGEP